MTLSDLLRRGRRIRAIGFDDGPGATEVPLAGVVTNPVAMEGLVWRTVTRDGHDATDVLVEAVATSKYAAQVHVVLIDGITVGGLNVVDLERTAATLGVPAVAVMRRPPDLAAFDAALAHLPDVETRRAVVRRAGPVHAWDGGAFQVVGAAPTDVARLLPRLTRQGHVPECLRLAHLITGAVATGASGRRA